MLHFLLSVTTTVIEMIILFGMLFGYAVQKQLWEVRVPALRGFYLGLGVAIILAILELTTGFIVREYYNLIVLVIAAPSALLLLSLLIRSRNLPSEKAATPFLSFAFFMTTAAWAAFYLPNIFLFPSHFAVGTVTVFSTEFVLIVTGYVLGLLLVILVGLAVASVSAALSSKVLFPLLSIALVAFIANQCVTVLQTLVGRGLIPRYEWALDIVIFLLSYEHIFLFTILGMGALAALALWRQSRAAMISGANPAEKRKSRSLIVLHVRWSKSLVLTLCIALIIVTVGGYYDTKKVELVPPTAITATDTMVIVPLTLVNDGTLHRFSYITKKGVEVRFLVIKKTESAYGVGLDACDVCGASGYYQRKDEVVCILCDVVMNKKTIGFAGGCNPVPLKFVIQDGNLNIETKSLEAEATRFM